MKKFLLVAMLALSSAMFLVGDANAKNRLGGGKSTGMQRENVQRDVPKAPAQNSVAPATAPAAAPASGMGRWL